MSDKPIFVATHPRACSTAFERVFMTRRDALACVHEPFGDAFYYGPERLSERFEKDEEARTRSGFANSTYKTIMDRIEKEGSEGKRVFIKDIVHYLIPPNGKPAVPAPSLCYHKGSAEPGTDSALAGKTNGDAGANGVSHASDEPNGAGPVSNPTVMPRELLSKFHWTFLIRHPRRAIPSYYRCTVPPLADATGFYNFMPSEAGYDELRRIFDYLKSQGLIGPARAGENPGPEGVTITVVDADDMLDQPAKMIEAFCREVGLDYTPDMLRWDDEETQKHAVDAFAKWHGFHNDAIDSTCLRPRTHAKKTPTREQEDEEWKEKFGEEAQKVIRECVDANTADYEYLKSFAIKV